VRSRCRPPTAGTDPAVGSPERLGWKPRAQPRRGFGITRNGPLGAASNQGTVRSRSLPKQPCAHTPHGSGSTSGRAAARNRTSSSITRHIPTTTRHDCARSGSSWSVTARISSRSRLVMATSSSTFATSMARTVGSGMRGISSCPAPGCSRTAGALLLRGKTLRSALAHKQGLLSTDGPCEHR
jgi:hypothetical protein